MAAVPAQTVSVSYTHLGHAQRVHEPAAHGHVLPAGLGGVGDVAVGRGILIEIHGAEAAHAQRLDALVGKEADDVREGRLRIPRGIALARKNLAFFIAQGTDQMCIRDRRGGHPSGISQKGRRAQKSSGIERKIRHARRS